MFKFFETQSPITNRILIPILSVISLGWSSCLHANVPGQTVWLENVHDALTSEVTVSENRLLFKTQNDNSPYCQGSIVSLDNLGDELWRYPTSGFCQNSQDLSLSETGGVYFFDSDSETNQCGIVALNNDGQERFRLIDSQRCSQGFIATLQNGSVVFATQDDYTTELRLVSANGNTLWQTSFDFTIIQLSIAQNRDVHVLSSNGEYVKVDFSGSTSYGLATKDSAWRTLIELASQSFIVTTDQNQVCRFEGDIGYSWCYQAETVEDLSIVVDADQNVFIASSLGEVIALNANGEKIWSYESGVSITHSLTLGANYRLYATSSDHADYGVLIAIDAVNGFEIWRADIGAASGSAAIDDNGSIYIGNAQGDVMSIASTSSGLAPSYWPKHGGGNLNTNRAPSSARPNLLDYDGDFKADIGIRRPETQQFFTLQSGTSVIAKEVLGSSPSDVPLHGDFDGDGLADIASYRPSTGTWLIQPSSDQEEYCYTFGALNNEVPAPADYDGDGITDIAFIRPSHNQWVVLPSSTPNDYYIDVFAFASADVPVPADYDGDGKADLAVRRPTSNSFVYVSSLDQSTNRVSFGLQETDIAVPADYDGDGITDIAIRRPTNGTWYIRYSTDENIYSVYFGTEYDDIPVPADYDGDGKADIAIRRPANGTTYIANSGSGGYISQFRFGLRDSDIPIAAPINIKMAMAEASNEEFGSQYRADEGSPMLYQYESGEYAVMENTGDTLSY